MTAEIYARKARLSRFESGNGACRQLGGSEVGFPELEGRFWAELRRDDLEEAKFGARVQLKRCLRRTRRRGTNSETANRWQGESEHSEQYDERELRF
jgi:hypothetical protein